jgi:plasmid stability protein
MIKNDCILSIMQSLLSINKGCQVSSITVRNLPEETHRALRVRAAMAGRSTEAEVRAILESIARPEGRIKLGSLLAEIGQQAGGFDLEIERDKLAAEPMRFE